MPDEKVPPGMVPIKPDPHHGPDWKLTGVDAEKLKAAEAEKDSKDTPKPAEPEGLVPFKPTPGHGPDVKVPPDE